VYECVVPACIEKRIRDLLVRTRLEDSPQAFPGGKEMEGISLYHQQHS